MNTRKCVLMILESFDEKHQSLDILIDEIFNKNFIERRDRRLIFEIVYGILRNKTLIEYNLAQYVHHQEYIENRQLMRILSIGAYQMLFLSKIPDHAAVNESVLLAKNDKRTARYSGVVNAVLRTMGKNKRPLPKALNDKPFLERLSIQYSHPEWLVKRWLERFNLSDTKKILEYDNSIPFIYIRRSVRGIAKQQFEKELAGVVYPGKEDQGYKNLYYRLKKQVLPEQLALFNDGYCTVQSPSSGWVTALLDCRLGDTVLDVCAAPGGKTTLIAQLVGKEGVVYACDIDFGRLKKARENCMRMHIQNTLFVVCNGTHLPFKTSFKKVLLDAPCSGTGVLQRHPEARWIKREQDLVVLSGNQQKLVQSVSPFVSNNGILVYSTCSLEKEENECRIEQFLERNGDFLLEQSSPFVRETFVTTKGYLQITPFEHKLDGMFAARLVKRQRHIHKT